MELTSKPQFAREQKEKGQLNLWSAAGLILFSFFISRACFLGQMFPAGIALLAVLVSSNTRHLYLLPVMMLGTGSFYCSGIPVFGDLGGLCGCGLLFLCTAKIRFAGWHKALIAGSISIIAQSVYYIAAGFTYRISVKELVLEGCLTALLCGIFQIAMNLKMEREPHSSIAKSLLTLSAGIMLIASGTGLPWLLLPAAMTATLFTGYLLGTMEGLLTAFASGAVILFCGEAPAVIFVLALGGIVAGLSRGQNKAAASLCFAASVMGMGLTDFSVSLAVPYYGPLCAAALLTLIPEKWLMRINRWLSTMLKNDTYKETQQNRGSVMQLEEAKRNFDQLSSMFVSQDNRRMLLSYEFKALSKVMDHTIKSITGNSRAFKENYQAEAAWAGYARNQDISGDSYMWEELPGGKFAIVLSDGMGKGKLAAGESSLAVTTVVKLLKSGLEAELVLRILNSILLLNAEKEIFSTIDLGIFNKKNGKMKFYKIGAAATFIKRKDRVEMLSVSAMPLGIVDGLKIDHVTADLNPGDQIIMISDGVTDSRREDMNMKWLKKTIKEINSKDPQTMCDLIMNRAVENYGCKEKDDLTVLAVKIS